MSTATIERPKKAAATKATPAKPSTANFESLKATVEQVRATIELAIQSAEIGSAAETLMRHLDESLLSNVADSLRTPSLCKSDLSVVYEGLFVPLAMIEGAIALSSGTVIESTLREAHSLLDWIQTEMDDAGQLARSLPDNSSASPGLQNFYGGRGTDRGDEATGAPLSECGALNIEDEVDESEARRRLAFDTNFQVSKLAETIVRLLEANPGDDFLVYQGILARIQLCADLTFYLMRLHGDSDENFGAPSLPELQRMFDGAAA